MAAIVYAFSDTPVYSFLLVKALIVICVANSAVFGSLYILERLFPTWKVYKRFLRMFKCLRVRATRIYTTNLTNDQKTRKFDDQSPDGNVDKPLHGLLATENEEDNNDDEMDDYLTNDEKRNRIHFSRNNAYQDQRKNNSHSGYGSMSKRFVFIQQFFVLNLMIINILYFIHTVIQEDCNHYSNSTFSAMFRNCRSEQIKSNRIDIYPLLFMFTPVLLSCIFRETLFEIQIANHFIVVLLGLLSTIVTNFNGLSIAEMEKIQVKEPPNQPNERDLSHDANDLTPFSFLREHWTRQLSESVFGKRRFSTVIPSKPSSVSASLDPINGDNSENESYLISNSPSMPPSLISTREDSIPALETALTRQKSRLYSIEEGNEKTVTKRFDSTEIQRAAICFGTWNEGK
eukprot:gene1657-1754_t